MKATFCWILSKWPGQLPCHLFFAGLSNPFKTRCEFEYYKEEMFCPYYSLASTCNSKQCRGFINVIRRRATRSKLNGQTSWEKLYSVVNLLGAKPLTKALPKHLEY